MITKKKNIMAALIAGIACISLMQAATIIHLDQDFESLSPGALSNGNGWNVGPSLTAAVVSSPVYQGKRALDITRTGSGALIYSSNSAGKTSLVLSNDNDYEWSFAFRLDSTTKPPASTTLGFLYLDTGAAGGGFSGLSFSYNKTQDKYSVGYYSSLSGSITGGTSYTLLGLIDSDTWHTAQFLITRDDSGQIGYTLSLDGGTSISVAAQASNAGTGATNYVRMVWSPQGNDSRLQLDNIYLATVPEPSAILLMLIGLGLFTKMFTRKRICA